MMPKTITISNFFLFLEARQSRLGSASFGSKRSGIELVWIGLGANETPSGVTEAALATPYSRVVLREYAKDLHVVASRCT